jgi:hypothetical protein
MPAPGVLAGGPGAPHDPAASRLDSDIRDSAALPAAAASGRLPPVGRSRLGRLIVVDQAQPWLRDPALRRSSSRMPGLVSPSGRTGGHRRHTPEPGSSSPAEIGLAVPDQLIPVSGRGGPQRRRRPRPDGSRIPMVRTGSAGKSDHNGSAEPPAPCSLDTAVNLRFLLGDITYYSPARRRCR